MVLFLTQYSGYYGIKRNGYEMIGNYEYPLNYEDTGAIDSGGRIIQRAKASVLMLPVHNDDSSKFKLLGHSNNNYGSEYNVEIEEYSFDSSVNYGEEVNAHGVNELVNVNFVNADSNYSDLVPTDSCQFIGDIANGVPKGNSVKVPFGNRWDAKLNDIYCNLNGSLLITHVRKGYIQENINNYISGVFLNGLYNTRFLNKSKSMYLYNIEESEENITSIGDTIELSVKRLPVINLTGKISKSDFDSSKPYIYILRDDVYDNSGLLLCRYDDLDSDLVLQVTDYSSLGNYFSLGGFRMLTKETGFTIFCSSTAPDQLYLCNKTDGNATDVYRLVCQPTDMNKEVEHTLTKLN